MQMLTGPRRAVGQVAFSPDGRFLAAGHRGLVLLWDLAAGALVHSWQLDDLCLGLAFSGDGRFLASADYARGYAHLIGLRVWRLTEPYAVAFERPGCNRQVWMTQDGTWVFGCGDTVPLTRWDTQTWVEQRIVFPEGLGHFWRILVRPDGQAVAVTICEQDSSRVVMVGLDGKVRGEWISPRGFAWPQEYLPAGRLLAVTGRRVVLFDEAGEEGARLSACGPLTRVAASGDSAWIVAATSQKVHQWGGPGWAAYQRLQVPVRKIHALAVAPDGHRGAVGDGGGRIVVWDLD